MSQPYRTAEEPEESETAKVARQAEREMLETFARLLSETNPHEIGQHIRRLDLLAHERRLAIRLECARRMIMPTAFSFVVVDGVLERAPVPSRGGAT